MEIILGKNSGFCFGVKNAVEKTKQELIKNKSEIYCLGELIHNKEVISQLEELGLKIIENESKAKEKIIIRAHGITKQIYEYLESNQIEVIDLTCPKVLKIHNIVEEFAQEGYFIFLIGMKNHPETIGNISFCGENSVVIEEEKDIQDGLSKFGESNIENILIIVQTTFSVEKFEKFCEIIKQNVGENKKIVVKKTICDSTRVRQEEAKETIESIYNVCSKMEEKDGI